MSFLILHGVCFFQYENYYEILYSISEKGAFFVYNLVDIIIRLCFSQQFYWSEEFFTL